MISIKAFTLWANNLTEMANNTTPNTFLIILRPLGPKKRSMDLDVFNTIKITTTFRIMATIIFSILNSALKDSKVVKVPGPAIKGNAKGNIDALVAVFSSCL